MIFSEQYEPFYKESEPPSRNLNLQIINSNYPLQVTWNRKLMSCWTFRASHAVVFIFGGVQGEYLIFLVFKEYRGGGELSTSRGTRLKTSPKSAFAHCFIPSFTGLGLLLGVRVINSKQWNLPLTKSVKACHSALVTLPFSYLHVDGSLTSWHDY